MIYIGCLIIIIQAEPDQAIRFVPFDRPVRPRGDVVMTCEKCGWNSAYETLKSGRMGIAGHKRWCDKKHR